MTYTSIACSQCGAPLPVSSLLETLVCEYCCTSHITTLPPAADPAPADVVEPTTPPRTVEDIRQALKTLEHEWLYILRQHSVYYGDAPCAKQIMKLVFNTAGIALLLLVCTAYLPLPISQAVRNLTILFEIVLCVYWFGFCSHMMEIANKLKPHQNRINIRRRQLEAELTELEGNAA